MRYLSGGGIRQSVNHGLGVLLTPFTGNRPDLERVVWAADTGCFAQPARHSDRRFLDWLDQRPRATCLFATAPDVVADAVATWERSRLVLPQIRALGYPAALVAQDGLEAMAVPWDAFDALFIGGSTAWKLGPAAFALGREATARGKHLHWGRVNSIARLKRARLAGADSVDGTFVAFAPDILAPQLARWLDMVNAQGLLLYDGV